MHGYGDTFALGETRKKNRKNRIPKILKYEKNVLYENDDINSINYEL